MPCGPEKIELIVQSYLKRLGKKLVFKDNLQEEDWIIPLKKRWNHRLSYCKPELLTKARAHSFSIEALDHFFDILADVYSQSDPLVAEDAAEKIFNRDETGCSTDPPGIKMLFKESSKENYLMTPNCASGTLF